MTGGLATDQEMTAWARTYMLAFARHQPARPAAATAIFQRRRPFLYGLAVGIAMLVLFLGWQLGRRPEARPLADTLVAASSEPPVRVMPAEPTPEPNAAASSVPNTAATAPREGDDRPARKTRQGLAPPNGSTHPRDDRSHAGAAKEKGILDIGSEPAFAYVAIDGVKVGATPIFGREVAPGSHRIQVWRDGLGSKTFTVEIRPGDRITRVVKLP